jgi:hypothetical protein
LPCQLDCQLLYPYSLPFYADLDILNRYSVRGMRSCVPRRSSCIGSSPPLLQEDYILLVCGEGRGWTRCRFYKVCAGPGRRMLTCQLRRNSATRVSGFTLTRVNILQFSRILITTGEFCLLGGIHYGILEEKWFPN